SQKKRATILCKEYLELKELYLLSQRLPNINNNNYTGITITQLAHRHNK
ncbi:MAG: hypothetical protein ACI9HJ_002234, partial [Ulvibacter sp.]